MRCCSRRCLRIEPVIDADLGAPPWAAVLLSSANAARAIAAHPRIGELTIAAGARRRRAQRASGTRGRLRRRSLRRWRCAGFGARWPPPVLPAAALPLLYLAGEDRARDLAGDLGGLIVRTVVIYRAVKATSLPLRGKGGACRKPPRRRAAFFPAQRRSLRRLRLSRRPARQGAGAFPFLPLARGSRARSRARPTSGSRRARTRRRCSILSESR